MSRFLSKILVAIISFLQLFFPQLLVAQPTHEAGMASLSEGLYTYYYPAEAVHAATADTVFEFLTRSDNPTSFEGENNGRDGTAILSSPYFSATLNESAVPVYSTLVYSATTGEAELHSYATVFVSDPADAQLSLELTAHGFRPEKAAVLPTSLGVEAQVNGKKITANLNACGTYSFMFDENDQEHAFTLFVKEYTDEDSEIAEYQKLYGEENVTVFEPGVYEIDYLDIQKDNSIVYLKAGSVLLAKHKFEMTAAEQDMTTVEDNAPQSNSLGLQRFPVINFFACSNVKLLGNGTVDMTQLDWNERRGVIFSSCQGVEIRDVVLINSPAWTLVAHCCDSVEISNVAVFGYRTNSDGIAITNTKNATVSDCFARSGDDLFEVKTLNTSENFPAENVLFENCHAWNGKARCFGITHEVYYPVSDITFRNCAVLYRDATWDNDIVCSLAVQVGEGGAAVKNILFENIEIYKDLGRPINILFMSDEISNGLIDSVTFRNVTYDADMQPQIRAENSNTISNIKFE